MPTRKIYTEEIKNLYHDILKMGTMVEEALRKGIRTFTEKDIDAAHQIIKDDEKVNDLQLSLEDRITILIATEQPVARDLRLLVSMLKFVSNLERMGDHAVHLSRATIRLQEQSYVIPLSDLERMAEIGISMVHDVLTAFMESSVEKALEIAKNDQLIDELYKKVIGNLLHIMRQNPDAIEQATSLLFISRFLERLGDHVTNLCEWIVYTEQGKHVELN